MAHRHPERLETTKKNIFSKESPISSLSFPNGKKLKNFVERVANRPRFGPSGGQFGHFRHCWAYVGGHLEFGGSPSIIIFPDL